MKKKYKVLSSMILSLIIVLSGILTIYLTKTYTVIYDTKGGTIIASDRVKPYSILEQPDAPIMEGYVFVGWEKDGEVYDFTEKIDGNVTLTAIWESVV